MELTLKAAFDKFKALPFPEFPELDELEEWTTDLAEFDGHVAGIANAALSESSSSIETTSLVSETNALKVRLSQINIKDEQDIISYNACAEYLSSLEDVVLALHKQSH